MLALLLGPIASVDAAASASCEVAKAKAIWTVGDRYRAGANYPSAARAYLVVAHATEGCRTGMSALLAPRALALAGIAYAQNGDSLRALSLLNAAQSRFARIGSSGQQTAAEAASNLEQVEKAISAIGAIAQSSM